MPELPEVENFRYLLSTLISSSDESRPLRLSLTDLKGRLPPKRFLNEGDVNHINANGYRVSDVVRKGKQIRMTLTNGRRTGYLFVHMGMTGRISTLEVVPKLKEAPSGDYPPSHTYLSFTSGDREACFSDPRKFGAVTFETSPDGLDSLAPDALNDLEENCPRMVEKLAGQSLGIKALLLDQKRAMSGVGNWVADEVLYQISMHPDQTGLTAEDAKLLLGRLHDILSVAVGCLLRQKDFPEHWLFHFRWNNKKTTKDYRGSTVTFVTSGGRTSAIVPSIQKKKLPSVKKSASKKRSRTPVSPNGDRKGEDNSRKKRTSKPKDSKVKVELTEPVKLNVALRRMDNGNGRRRSVRIERRSVVSYAGM